MTPESCPQCGTELAPRARACPECGSCEETGWSERASSDRLGLPDPEFNYEEYVQREFGPPVRRQSWMRWFWTAVACGLAAWLLWSYVPR